VEEALTDILTLIKSATDVALEKKRNNDFHMTKITMVLAD